MDDTKIVGNLTLDQGTRLLVGGTTRIYGSFGSDSKSYISLGKVSLKKLNMTSAIRIRFKLDLFSDQQISGTSSLSRLPSRCSVASLNVQDNCALPGANVEITIARKAGTLQTDNSISVYG